MKRRNFAAIALVLCVCAVAWSEEPITRVNWGAMVGFAPDLAIPGWSDALTIDATNVDAFRMWIAEPTYLLVRNWNLKIVTRPYEAYAPTDGYIDATNKYRGQAKALDTGGKTDVVGLGGYTAGLPFPDPKTGEEVAWNFLHGHHGDDGRHEFGVYWVSAKRGVERNEVWRWFFISNTKHRTDIDPKPVLAEFADRNIAAISMTETLFPPDLKGQLALYIAYDNPTEREGWVYVPSQRRTVRFTSDGHGEAWNNTDLLYEDVRGYSGRPEWMNWKILRRATILAPMGAGVEFGPDAAKKTYDFETPPHWNPRLKWQPRPVYVVEATPRLARYPYSRQVFYIDAEAFYIHMKEAYDAKGQLWKVLINASNVSNDPATKPPLVATSFVVDLQAEHATVFPWFRNEANVGIDPNKLSLTEMRKKSR
ncbi:MAG: DUF1329 domain-containing protein [Deltaproteobacteria bacterium]|nr:DUF1329 domain-containing protein [Deltaproteobacteria bacterium]